MSTIDQFGRSITCVDNGDGTKTYSTIDGIAITEPDGMDIADIVRIFNGMSPSVANLSSEKQMKIVEFNLAVLEFVQAKYDRDTQLRFLVIYQLAMENGLTNRANYIRPLLNWTQTLLTYASSFVLSVMSQSDALAVAGMNWDLGSAGAVPTITILGAIAITN